MGKINTGYFSMMTPEIRAVCAELTTVRQAISHLRHAAEAAKDADITMLVSSLETEAASLMRVIQRHYGSDVETTSEEGRP